MIWLNRKGVFFFLYLASYFLMSDFNLWGMPLVPVKEKLPTEYFLLYQCFEQQEALLDQDKKARLNQLTEELNQELNLIPAEHLFATLKAELYLFFLERSTLLKVNPLAFNPIPWFEDFLKTTLQQQQQHCSFTQWILQALYQDGLTMKEKQIKGGKPQLWKQTLGYWQELLDQKNQREQQQVLLEQYLQYLEHLKLKLSVYRQLGPGPKIQEQFFISKATVIPPVTSSSSPMLTPIQTPAGAPAKSKEQLLDEILEKSQ